MQTQICGVANDGHFNTFSDKKVSYIWTHTSTCSAIVFCYANVYIQFDDSHVNSKLAFDNEWKYTLWKTKPLKENWSINWMQNTYRIALYGNTQERERRREWEWRNTEKDKKQAPYHGMKVKTLKI